MTYPTYNLTLRKTYYWKGFFNLGVEIERFVTQSEGEIELKLGQRGRHIRGRVTRAANNNGTPRVFGGKTLSDWFQANFELMDTIRVQVLSPTELLLVSGD